MGVGPEREIERNILREEFVISWTYHRTIIGSEAPTGMESGWAEAGVGAVVVVARITGSVGNWGDEEGW